MRGSPAHAGMDPIRAQRYHVSQGLPRTRGDGPFERQPTQGLNKAPPHTRGWTLKMMMDALNGGGSPAHAGMDPREER